jgi:Ca2+-binding RTX toxin-like protein
MSLQGTVLTFNGSAADDLVGISSDGATLSIYSRQSFTLPHSAVSGIVLRGNGGADAFKIHHTLTIPATLDGGSGDDELEGGAGDDLLLGGDGDDGIRGHRGNDTMDGGFGADDLEGDGGFDPADYSSRTNPLDIDLLVFDDVNFGADGEAGEGDDVPAERVLGGAGNDRISGFLHPLVPGNDAAHALFGGPGNDTLNGGGGNDQLFGEAGNDVLLGGDGDDYLEGGAGGDELYGQAGRDALFGLAGNGRLFADDGAADTVRGGQGDDGAEADPLDDVLAVEAIS